jgi:hypothetical protein
VESHVMAAMNGERTSTYASPAKVE